MSTLRKHRKQWLILRQEMPGIVERYPEFRVLKMPQDLYLYHDCDLNISTIAWADGTSSIVLGDILGSPESPLKLHYQMGRFVAIRNSVLSLDATGFMSVYFATDKDALVCCSSQILASEFLDKPLARLRNLKASPMNWDPVPLTRLPRLKRLFTDEALNLTEGTTWSTRRGVVTGQDAVGASENLARLLAGMAESLKNIQQPIYLPLTGGSDSRAIFSALLHARVRFEAFTFVLGDDRSAADARTAATICKRYGVAHHAIERQGQNAQDLETYRAHCGGVVGDRGEVYVAGNYHRHFPDGAVLLHGGGWEIGQRFYEKRLGGVDSSLRGGALDDLSEAFGGLGEHERAALGEWLHYRIENPIAGVDLVDGFYIDQRRGGWGASNAQEADVFGYNFLMLSNSWAVINEILSVSVEERRANAVQMRVMDLLTPGISRVTPINPKTVRTRWAQWKRRTKSALRRFKGSLG